MSTATTNDQQEHVTLVRDLTLFSSTMISVGAMIGAGIFVLTGTGAGLAGPALTLAFVLNGIATIFTAIVYAELGSCFPDAGGGYFPAGRALRWRFPAGEEIYRPRQQEARIQKRVTCYADEYAHLADRNCNTVSSLCRLGLARNPLGRPAPNG